VRRSTRNARRREADRRYAQLLLMSGEEARKRQDARARIAAMDDGRRHVYRGAWSVLRLGASWIPETPDGEARRSQYTAEAACDYIDKVLDQEATR